ncbi:polyprenyl synthetase family protein [Aerococcaceae bacterium zg-ZUI334]|uniref:polyprenyl synthetase family protein n=1 Tax=Aerococcaceae bacterium zg-252 TaxID=2796928 RepID=UPI001B9A7706|nr:polyprenyl synthetase family protein [Aerococcaceae bacterium zg-ZUI334]
MSILTFDNFREIFNRGLEQTTRYETTPIELMEPMIYSLLNGGKRVRPVMLLWILGIQGIDSVKLGLKTAIALEYIHTYSLIHDDLPAMDNDDYRRGQLTSHKKFGEATAILTGDALLTDAFNLIATDDFLTAEQKVQIVHLLSQAAGSVGMVAGQMSDIQSEGQAITLEQLARIHYLKTGKLFLFAVQAASVIAELPIKVQERLEQFAAHFGRAFQIHNDIMDEIGTLDTTGKQTQADSALEKATYPSLLSLDGAKQALSDEVAQAMKILETLTVQTGKDYQSLAQFLSFVSVE